MQLCIILPQLTKLTWIDAILSTNNGYKLQNRPFQSNFVNSLKNYGVEEQKKILYISVKLAGIMPKLVWDFFLHILLKLYLVRNIITIYESQNLTDFLFFFTDGLRKPANKLFKIFAIELAPQIIYCLNFFYVQRVPTQIAKHWFNSK